MIHILFEEQAVEHMEKDPLHIPVMSREVIEFLNLKPGSVIVDGTLGTAGHAVEICSRIGLHGRLIGIDRDGDSLELAKEKLQEYERQCTFVQDDYRNLGVILNQLGISEVDGMLFDLGISSFQLNNPGRGFSLKHDGPLDMRMDQQSYISAYDLINSLSEREISSILRNFGEERFHNRIAHVLIDQRAKAPIESTKDLSDAILKAIPYRYQHQKIHPATRTFQAIRIAVNRELEALEILLEKNLGFLKMGGRICVIAFHSLEDRIVKEKFRNYVKEGRVKLLVKKPLRPTEEEIALNVRARSARLRAAERIK